MTDRVKANTVLLRQAQKVNRRLFGGRLDIGLDADTPSTDSFGVVIERTIYISYERRERQVNQLGIGNKKVPYDSFQIGALISDPDSAAVTSMVLSTVDSPGAAIKAACPMPPRSCN